MSSKKMHQYPQQAKNSYMDNWTQEEATIICQYAKNAQELHRAGDEEGSKEWMKKIPVMPSFAFFMKRTGGIEAVQQWINDGYDFSLVEAEYGKDWLYK